MPNVAASSAKKKGATERAALRLRILTASFRCAGSSDAARSRRSAQSIESALVSRSFNRFTMSARPVLMENRN
jgi:hypothetical protein